MEDDQRLSLAVLAKNVIKNMVEILAASMFVTVKVRGVANPSNGCVVPNHTCFAVLHLP